jgi:hypothetical protein
MPNRKRKFFKQPKRNNGLTIKPQGLRLLKGATILSQQQQLERPKRK